MRTVSRVMLCGLLVAAAMGTAAAVEAKPNKHGRNQQVAPASGTQVSVQVVFSRHDLEVIREYYAPRYRSLPPGLQKKYQRTGQLPPGWQKKVEPFPPTLERRLVVLPDGYRRGVFDGRAVIYNPRSGAVFDVAVIF